MDTLAEQDTLIVFAEVSVAIAGFAGIMAVVGRSTNDLDKFRIKGLVVGAAALVLFSLLPIVLALSGILEETLWRSVSGIRVTFDVLVYVAFRDDLALFKTRPLLMVSVAGECLMVLALLAAVLGYPLGSYSFVYAGSLFWALFQVLTVFVHSISSLWESSST